ncbi:MAG: hypothetical protein J0H88_19155 [Sphingomonadales bacterium]|nr:hypothetical protein [Sphingomonadales bacterium]
MTISNAIPQRQNEEGQLRLMRARQWTFKVATRFLTAQMLLTVAVPIVGSIWTLFVPALRPHLAALTLAILVLDTLYLDRRYKSLVKRAAKISEQFDCTVLELPWNNFVAGEKVEAEDTGAAARAWAKHENDDELVNWYPVAAGQMPISLGRILCQRTNLRYDSSLRQAFGSVILALVTLVLGGLVVAGLAEDLSLTAWVLTLAPATPLLSWAGREYYRQRDTIEQLDELKAKATSFGNEALAGTCSEADSLARSRAFQDAIYLRRATSPLVVPFLYRFKRQALEGEMEDAAADFLKYYENSPDNQAQA